ncbi:MAG: thioesterase family protein [Actinobacteria bacterium]|nr:thioesterase family protein [Actinomycetota bacterium]
MNDSQVGRPFIEASQPKLHEDGTWAIEASPQWAQGRTLFGGLIAANVCFAMETLVQPDQVLRSISTNFAAPLSDGEAALRVELDRAGSATSFTSATVEQDGALRSRAQAVFARSRASTISVHPTPPQLDTAFDAAETLPYVEGLLPAFLQRFDIRWGIGDYPFSGSQKATLGGYIRHQRPVPGARGILGLLDAWPPAILPMAAGPAAASTVSWTAHIVSDIPAPSNEWFEFHYDTIAAKDGYATFVGTLSQNGDVIAWTEQLAAVFA